jgi:hypothetical protein
MPVIRAFFIPPLDRGTTELKIITCMTSCAEGRTETSAHKNPFEEVPPGSASEGLDDEVCVTREYCSSPPWRIPSNH